MACIVCLIRAPRYKDVSIEQIRLIDSYFQWRNYRNIKEISFEKWGGHSVSEVPPLEVLKYFKPFFNRERIESDDPSGYACYGIFERVARFVKATQFLNWMMRNVIRSNDIPFEGTYEVSREQLEQLLEACNRVRRYGINRIYIGEADEMYDEGVFEVNEAIARTFLPILDPGGCIMAPYEYDSIYAGQVICAIRVLNEILATTNFQKQAIYFKCEYSFP